MKFNKTLTDEEIQKRIKEINGTMAQEGMPLTKELKEKLYLFLKGDPTYEEELKK